MAKKRNGFSAIYLYPKSNFTLANEMTKLVLLALTVTVALTTSCSSAPSLNPQSGQPLLPPPAPATPLPPPPLATPTPAPVAANLPTSTPFPGQTILPALPPISMEEALPPIVQDRAVYPPSDEMSVYVDENFGFSFRYPSNWILQAPGKMDVDLSRGYSVELVNYDASQLVIRKGSNAFPLNEVKIGLSISLYSGKLDAESVQEWLHTRYHPKTEFTFVEEDEREGLTEYKWIAEGGILPKSVAVSVVVKDGKAYLFNYIPADTDYKQTAEEVARSLTLPRIVGSVD